MSLLKCQVTWFCIILVWKFQFKCTKKIEYQFCHNTNHMFWIGGDDIEWRARIIPYSSTTNKGDIKGMQLGDIFVPKGLVWKF